MTAPARLDLFAPIVKREKDPKTGHLYVYGKITGSDLDRDQQGMDATWLKTAVPDWFTRGNLREQHDPKKAVGKAVELEEKADGWYIGAKVVDREAIVKVEEEVLTGFSIGIKGPRLDMTKVDYPRGLVTGGRICETSLVDVPSLPTATIQDHWEIPLAKADAAGELQPVEDPELVRVEADPAAAETYGLPAELFGRLAAPVKQALAALAEAGAEVTAAPEDAAKSDDPATPVLVSVTVSADAIAEIVRTQGADYAGRDAAAALDALDKAYSAEQKRAALKAGHAIPNAKGEPSYVIKTKADLRKAIKAVGRGNADHDDIRKHVIKRAKALGLEAMVPDNWNADGSLKDDATKADAATIEKAEAVLRDVRTLVPELAKADDEPGGGEDESDDIAGAQEAITCIAKLIVSEAESLAAGNLNEAVDIALLLDAVRALKWFQCNERNEQSGLDDMLLADTPDLEKAKGKNGGKLAPPFKKKGAADGEDEDGESEDDSADDDGDEDDGDDKKKSSAKKTDAGDLLTKADAAEAIKAAVAAALAAEPGGTQTSPADQPESVTKADLADMVKTAVAEAKKADEERITALTANLAKAQGEIDTIKATPVPGGPVLTRTSAQQDSAVKTDAVILRAQAAELLEKAEKFASNRDLAQGYRDRAKALLVKAAA